MNEIEIKLEQLRTRKGVKYALVMNLEGEVVTSLVNDMSISEAEVQEKFHKLAYSVFASSKAAVSQFDSNEQFQLGRIRMRDTELIIYQDEKFVLAVFQDPVS